MTRHLHRVTLVWLSTRGFARLRALQPRRARMILAGWFAAPGEGVPRVQRVPSRRGKPSLCVLAEDVAALYALDVSDVHQLAA